MPSNENLRARGFLKGYYLRGRWGPIDRLFTAIASRVFDWSIETCSSWSTMTHVLTNPHLPPQGMKFRSKSAEISRKHVQKIGLSNKELDRIRSLSRQSWNRQYEDPGNPLPRVTTNHYQTTYTTSYSYKNLDEPTPSRATSPTRRNNPHPTK